MGPTDGTYDPAAASHRALRTIRRSCERHPLIETARGHPPALHSEVLAELHADRIERPVQAATLTVRWYAGAARSDRPEFSFHYSDESEADFGWHHEPISHVDGWGHYQERTASTDAYSYEPYSFSSLLPERVVWEVLPALSSRMSPD